MNIKKQYSIRQFGLPSVYSGTNILTQKDGYWYINDENTNVSLSTIPPQNNNEFFVKEGTQTDNYIFQKNLELLNQRINAIHKELTYWDLYKLTAAVTNEEDLDAVFSSLSIGQSLVINCPTFQRGDVVYSRGDVIVRTAEDQEIKIDSVATGIFIPTDLVRGVGNQYTLTYTYTPGEPDNEHKTPTFTLQDNDAATIYGELFTVTGSGNTFTFTALTNNGTDILPVIKTYTEDFEEINIDNLNIIKANDNWVISFEAGTNFCTMLKYIQVK